MSRWIVLRGLTREAGHWRDFARALEKRSALPVLPLDLPGNGTQWASRSPLDVAAIAEDLRQRAGVTHGPVLLVALSLGAMAALEWSRADPKGVAGCVLINTSMSGLSPFWQRLRPSNYPAVARMLLPGIAPLEREGRVLAMTSARPEAHPGTSEAWAEIARQRPVSSANALRQLWAAARYRLPTDPPPVPLLLLASQGDGLVSPQCSQRLAQHWDLPLRMHPWAGHDLPLDDPEWVLQQLIDWERALR